MAKGHKGPGMGRPKIEINKNLLIGGCLVKMTENENNNCHLISEKSTDQ